MGQGVHLVDEREVQRFLQNRASRGPRARARERCTGEHGEYLMRADSFSPRRRQAPVRGGTASS